ncbi:MAG: alkaline phosphatase [Clostridiaceae bacterium BRH_c20a]|nr:MAG: alkaline phosphatase [Clostridiaceae bacterium BRH_c20a]
MLSAEWLANILENLGYWAIIISLLLSILVAILGVLPSIFITGANVLAFGFYNGLLISWMGEVLGAGISFILYRWGIKRYIEKLGCTYPIIKKVTEARGIKVWLLIFEARLLPFVPSGIVTLAGAISIIGLFPFILATALGKLPSILLEVLISHGLIVINHGWLTVILTVLILLTLILFKFKK